MQINVEERGRNTCRIWSQLSFSVVKHRGSQMRRSEMSVIRPGRDVNPPPTTRG